MSSSQVEEPIEEHDEQPSVQTGTSRQQEWLFWSATILTFILAVGFFIASFLQLSFLHQKILDGSQAALRQEIDILSNPAHVTSEQIIAAGRVQSLVSLEMYALERRYHQANVLLMSRIWIRYLGFITGMILALMGGAFILGKLREPVSKVGGEIGGGRFSFEGASPGMFLSGLGVVLMLTTIIVHHRIEVTDRATYTHSLALDSESATNEAGEAPLLGFPDFTEADEPEEELGVDESNSTD